MAVSQSRHGDPARVNQLVVGERGGLEGGVIDSSDTIYARMQRVCMRGWLVR